MMTHRYSAEREAVWCDLSAILTCGFLAKKETMWHDLLCTKITFKKHNNGFIIVSMASVTTRYKPIQIIVLTVNEFQEPSVKCLAHGLDGLFPFG